MIRFFSSHKQVVVFDDKVAKKLHGELKALAVRKNVFWIYRKNTSICEYTMSLVIDFEGKCMITQVSS